MRATLRANREVMDRLRRVDAATLFVSLASLGSALIHLRAAKDHLREDVLYGAFFYGTAFAQAAIAVLLLAYADRRWALKGALVLHALVIAAWIQSRTAGPPIGADAGHVEVARFADIAATGLELLAVVVLAWRLTVRRPRFRPAGLWVPSVALLLVLPFIVSAADPHGPLCTNHASQPYSGPLGPIDGHSLLERTTPPAELKVGISQRVLLGKLINCDGHDVQLVEADVTRKAGDFTVEDFVLAPLEAPEAGRALGASAVVPPTGKRPEYGIFADIRPRSTGRVYVHAINARVQGTGPGQPFATFFSADVEQSDE